MPSSLHMMAYSFGLGNALPTEFAHVCSVRESYRDSLQNLENTRFRRQALQYVYRHYVGKSTLISGVAAGGTLPRSAV